MFLCEICSATVIFRLQNENLLNQDLPQFEIILNKRKNQTRWKKIKLGIGKNTGEMQFYQSYNDSTNYLEKSFTWAEFPHYFQKKSAKKRTLFLGTRYLKIAILL